MPILTRQSKQVAKKSKVLYIDGFAGPGEYRGGEYGSPMVAIDTALSHIKTFPSPIHMLFIEKREDRYNHLSSLLEAHEDRIDKSQNVYVHEPRQKDCEKELNSILDRYEKKQKRFGPALVFLDQFGYSAVSINLIRRILSYQSCEVFSYLDWKDLNRFASDQGKWPGIDNAFGGDDWREAFGQTQDVKAAKLLEIYRKALADRAGARFFCSFSMHDQHGQLLYWLIFCTGNIRGLEEMKRAMWKVDETGCFRFSDKHANQLSLLKGFDQEWLAGSLSADLAGKQVTVKEIREHVLVETPCYLYNDALAKLERERKIDVQNAPPGRRKGSFKKYEDSAGMTIAFPLTLFDLNVGGRRSSQRP